MSASLVVLKCDWPVHTVQPCCYLRIFNEASQGFATGGPPACFVWLAYDFHNSVVIIIIIIIGSTALRAP
jgi:hypothetical protein